MTLTIALLSECPPRSTTKIFTNQNKEEATYLSQAIALPCVSMALRVTAMTHKMMFYFIAGNLCLQSVLESTGQDSYVAYETQSKQA